MRSYIDRRKQQTKTERLRVKSIKAHQAVHSFRNSRASYMYHGGSEEDVPHDVEKVIIDSSVTTIPANCFSHCASLKSIIIPEGITHIGDEAFSFCDSLTSVLIRKGVTKIGDRAFSDCTSLAAIVIPEGVDVIGDSAFYECTSLVSIVIPKSVNVIGDDAFYRCTSLAAIVLPQGVTKIGDRAFSYCTSIAAVVIPDGVMQIGNEAFMWCTSLPSIMIPESVTEIGDSAFNACASLAWIVIHEGVKTIGDAAFQFCRSLSSIIIPKGVTYIGKDAFSGCTSLAAIEIPEGITSLGDGTFYECTSLRSIVVPNGVTEIGTEAFLGCSSLASILIPQDLKTIGRYAFAGCTLLASILIPEGVTQIVEHAFQHCTSLESVVIPQGVTTIAKLAFSGCASLASIMIPEGVTKIGDCAFQGCTSLALIVIPKSTTTIGEHAFEKCPLLEKGAERLGIDVEVWLRTRFDSLAAHTMCYRSDVTGEKLLKCLEKHQEPGPAFDSLGLSALHVLLMNEKVTHEMVAVLLKSNPDAVKNVGPLGMDPLHLASNDPRSPLAMFKLLSSSYTKDVHHIPGALAIRYNRPDEVILYLFERYPIHASNLRTKQEREKLDCICEHYMKNLESEDYITLFDTLQQHRWVSFVHGVEIGSDSANRCAQLIEKLPIQIVGRIAYYKDVDGHPAIESAIKDIRTALKKRLFLLGRFELTTGPLLHKSSTCVIIKAIDRRAEDEYRGDFYIALKEEESFNEQRRSIEKKAFISLLDNRGWDKEAFKDQFEEWDLDLDKQISEEECVKLLKSVLDNGRSREVVLKFMRNAEQFRREVDFRTNLKLDSKYVVGINHHYNLEDTDEMLFNALHSFSEDEGLDLREYKYAIVMRLADRNLDTIFRSERPDKAQIRVLTKQLAEAIQHVHSNGLIHGDVKLQNVVRIGSRLRLIDLDAAVEIDSFAGAKFSSGVLPPEMIAKLTFQECNDFDRYFEKVKHNNTHGWAKIYPKKLGETAFFVVKTFSTEGVSACKELGERALESIKEYHPVVEPPPPYHLVKATEAIDIWSFGVVLYSLHAGSPLFDVNRDDDINTTQAMQELYEWDVHKKLTKLEKVSDPFAHKFLMKLLSRNPAERYESMEEILRDDYFSGNLVEILDDECKNGFDSIQKNTLQLLNTKRDILAMIENSTNVTFTAIFEATEVQTPTCFVILPYKIPFPRRDAGTEREVVAFGEAVIYIDYILDQLSNCITAPVDFEVEFAKSHYIESTMYLYLADEWTGQPVNIDGVYPLEIPRQSAKAKEFLPLMALGLKALALTSTAARIVSMFYPVASGSRIPELLLDKAKKFIEESNKSGIIEQVLSEGYGTNKAVRGNELSEFEKFLKETDVECTFSGLRRVCDQSSGMAMWVTEDSAKAMEEANSVHDNFEEVRQLKVELRLQAGEIRDLKEMEKRDAEEVTRLETANQLLAMEISDLKQTEERAQAMEKRDTEEVTRLKTANQLLASEISDLKQTEENAKAMEKRDAEEVTWLETANQLLANEISDFKQTEVHAKTMETSDLKQTEESAQAMEERDTEEVARLKTVNQLLASEISDLKQTEESAEAMEKRDAEEVTRLKSTNQLLASEISDLKETEQSAEATEKGDAEEMRRLEAVNHLQASETSDLKQTEQSAEATEKRDAEEMRRLEAANQLQASETSDLKETEQSVEATKKRDAEEKRRLEAANQLQASESSDLKETEQSVEATEKRDAEEMRRLEAANHLQVGEIKQVSDEISKLKTPRDKIPKSSKSKAPKDKTLDNTFKAKSTPTPPVVDGDRWC